MSKSAAEQAMYASIESGISTDIKELKAAQNKLKDDITRTDKALAELLSGDVELTKKLGLDIDQLGIDAEAIADLDRRENNKGEGKKKFVSPYASNTSLDTSSTDEKKIAKKAGAFSSLLSLVGIEKKISKKDIKKWTDLTEAAMQEKKTRDGCLRLLDVYRHQPEKGSPQATAELEYQVKELNSKIRLLRIGCDSAIPVDYLTPEQRAQYFAVYDSIHLQSDA